MADDIRHVAIVGGGKMGLNLFNYLSDFDFEITLYQRSPIDAALKKHHRKLSRQLKNDLISEEDYQKKINHQRITNSLQDLASSDLVIECVPEVLNTKKEIFNKLHEIVKPETILASNSSSILPDELIPGTTRSAHTLGLHFFYPIELKNIVEIIAAGQTDEATLNRVTQFLENIKRNYLLQKGESAFLLNRLMLTIQSAAFDLAQEHQVPYKVVDEAVCTDFLPVGIFEMMDTVGMEVMYHAVGNYKKSFPDTFHFDSLYKKIEALHRRGSQFASDEHDAPTFVDATISAEDIKARLKTIYQQTLEEATKDHHLCGDISSAMKEYLGF